MEVYYSIMLFILGTIFGSFYFVVGTRLPEEKSLLKPRSHCDNCKHVLKWYELIPVLSYLFQLGKCLKCKTKLSLWYPIFEILTGLLFALTYYVFKFTPEFFLTIILGSVILIIIVSDLKYMIISDEVLIAGIVLMFITRLIVIGYINAFQALFYGFVASYTMYLLKKFGDYVFKKESMGGGDIKLMFLMGYALGYPGALIALVIGSFVGLPLTLILLKKPKSPEIPFGPLLGLGSLITMFLKIDLETIEKILNII